MDNNKHVADERLKNADGTLPWRALRIVCALSTYGYANLTMEFY